MHLFIITMLPVHSSYILWLKQQ